VRKRYDRDVPSLGRLVVPRPPAFDVAFMVVLLVLSVLEDLVFPFQLNDQISTRDPDVLAFALLLLAVFPVVWRRTNPIPVFVMNGVGFLGRFLLGYSLVTGVQLAALISVYAVGAHARRPAANTIRWVAVAVVAIGFTAAALLERLPVFLVAVMTINWFGAGFFGELAYTRRQYQIALEERAVLLEQEQERRAERAVLDERSRIARDLHDVWAHTMSLIVVQAGAAQEVFDTRPDLTRQSLVTIQDAARRALAEVRRMVVVRNGDESRRHPAPGISDIDDLVAEFREAGLPVALERIGGFSGLPEDVSLTVFRIVQQALTNTLSHGGPAATVNIALTRRDGVVDLIVVDDGLGAEAPEADHEGRGLIGMRERVSMFGGMFSAGPIAAGGFRVEARIPTGTSS